MPLPSFVGEDVQIQLANIYSAMITQKQNNWRLQSGLALYAEPIAALLWFETLRGGMLCTLVVALFWLIFREIGEREALEIRAASIPL